jgi:hypothetical protein
MESSIFVAKVYPVINEEDFVDDDDEKPVDQENPSIEFEFETGEDSFEFDGEIEINSIEVPFWYGIWRV